MSDPFFYLFTRLSNPLAATKIAVVCGPARDLFALPGVPMHRQVPSYKMYRTLGNAHRNTHLGVRNDFIDLRFKDIYIHARVCTVTTKTLKKMKKKCV